MPVILVKAPRPNHEGMVADPNHEMGPGRPPPWVSPHCWQCRLPVERFTVDWVSSPYYLPIQFECHGKTGAMRIPHDEVMRKSRVGGLVWVFRSSK